MAVVVVTMMMAIVVVVVVPLLESDVETGGGGGGDGGGFTNEAFGIHQVVLFGWPLRLMSLFLWCAVNSPGDLNMRDLH